LALWLRYQWKDFGSATVRTSGGEMVSRHGKPVHFYPGIFGAEKDTFSDIYGEQDSLARVGGSFGQTET
jgi:hypothetical protein